MSRWRLAFVIWCYTIALGAHAIVLKQFAASYHIERGSYVNAGRVESIVLAVIVGAVCTVAGAAALATSDKERSHANEQRETDQTAVPCDRDRAGAPPPREYVTRGVG